MAALPTCVQISDGEGGLTADSVVLCHQMRALDSKRFRDKLGEITEEAMAAVENCILFTVGINLGEG